MKNQVIIKHENIQKYNEEDPLIDLPKNTKQLRYQYFRPACSLKTILITAGISTIFILNSLFLKIFYQYRISRLKMLYNQETVGIPTIRTEFNFTMVQQSQKYQFQTFLAKNLKPFDSTNCLLQNIEGAILCKNFITKSKAFIDFVSSQQKDDIGCKLLQKYSIIYHFYGCKADYIGSCQQNIKKYHNWCLSESPQRIFWTNYKSLNETITESKLQNEHILVKMILHQTEWASFRSFPLKRMDFIDQIILQFNIQEAYLWGNLDILSSILQKFYPVRLHMSNQHCRPDYMIERRLRKLQSSVFSVTLVNKNLLQLTADTRSFKLYQLQEQVKISQKNCQMPQKGYLVAQPIQLEQISWNQYNLHQLSLQHVHSKLKYNYPTMGKLHQPAGFNFQKIPQNERIQYYNHIADLFKPFNNTSCQYARYGDENDQGYVVCKNFLSQSTALLNFGIQGKDAFGCQISSEFNTPNLQYDCTNSTKPFCRSNNEKNYFYYACVAERSQYLPILNRTFYSLKEILDRHKLVRKHITLKMDIQASQWVTFRSLPIEYLDYIDQIIIQIHLFENFGYFKGNYDILNILEENFYPVNFHQNNYNCWRVAFCKLRSSVFEVTLVNKRILKLHSFSRSYVTTTLNKPNRKNSEDCQIIDYL